MEGVDFNDSVFILTPQNKTNKLANTVPEKSRGQVREKLNFGNADETLVEMQAGNKDVSVGNGDQHEILTHGRETKTGTSAEQAHVTTVPSAHKEISSSHHNNKENRPNTVVVEAENLDHQVVKHTKHNKETEKNDAVKTPRKGEPRHTEARAQVYNVRSAEYTCRGETTRRRSPQRQLHAYRKHNEVQTPNSRTPNQSVLTPRRNEMARGREKQDVINSRPKTSRESPFVIPSTPKGTATDAFAVPHTPKNRATPIGAPKFKTRSPHSPEHYQVTSMDDSCK